MIFFDANCLFRFLREQYEQYGGDVDIATYGITLFEEKASFGKTASAAMEFMDSLRGGRIDVRVLVGLEPVKRSRNASYGLREMEYRKKIREVLEIGYQYDICCLPTQKSHLKMYRIGDLYVVGGINLGNSTWADSAVVLERQEDKEAVQSVFDGMWHGACTVNPMCDIPEVCRAVDRYDMEVQDD
ncbi:MAG: hypothetical protein HFF18_08140 [Oscillospiraceae bacterium]|nr:hypothetical protein [Oscillospiraceae bacterium]